MTKMYLFLYLYQYIYPDLIYLCGVATYFAHFLHASANGLVSGIIGTWFKPHDLNGKIDGKTGSDFPN
jgi:uncharacterized oligopeptide transporter (OPT) family protein